jgi:16S rRNA (cytidine1402-2'-O)-methyltransferase
MSGILYVVATPIGNLEDITLRALRILRDVSLIAAEDTRRTGRLLQHYSISTPTTSLHEHNERSRAASLIARLDRGESIALVSDAGTPLISDPGQFLVSSARKAGIRVDAVPGASAVMSALSISGLPASEFTFLGFPPSRSHDREEWFDRLVTEQRLVVFFEAPHRIRASIEALGRRLGMDYEIGVGRELTKVHEKMVIRPISELLAAEIDPKGEYTVVIPERHLVIRPITVPDASSLAAEFGDMTNLMGLKPREAMKSLAERYGVSANQVYRAVVGSRKSVNDPKS